IFSSGVPLGILMYWLLTGTSATFDWAEIFQSLYSTLAFGFGGSFLAILFALPLVILAIRYKGAFSVIADSLLYFIYILLVLVFFAINYVHPLYQTIPLLLIGYAMLYLPLAQSAVRAAMEQVPKQMEEVGSSLGKSGSTVFFKVTLPLITPGVGAGMALVFLE